MVFCVLNCRKWLIANLTNGCGRKNKTTKKKIKRIMEEDMNSARLKICSLRLMQSTAARLTVKKINVDERQGVVTYWFFMNLNDD